MEAIANKNFSLQSLSHNSNKISQMWSLLEVVTYESRRKENVDCIRILDCIRTDVDWLKKDIKFKGETQQIVVAKNIYLSSMYSFTVCLPLCQLSLH